MKATITRSVPIVRTPRVQQLEGLFDVAPADRSEQTWTVDLPLEERDWQIGLIVGPSGCGKSTLARELFPNAMIDGFDWPADGAIVDGFPRGLSIKDITGALSSVGFSSPPSWLRPFRCLSNGEQFRATIARALVERPDLAVIDEFTSVVDRTVARVGSAAIAKAVRRRPGSKFVAVACHHDILDWLQPDWVYEPAGTGRFQWRSLQRRPAIELTIRRVHPQAWDLFKHHHYLDRGLARTCTCFVAFVEGRPAAFTAAISFAHPKSSGYREHRTVCLPDFQGVGIGNALSEFVASLYAAAGRRYYSTTSSPSMIGHRCGSALWRQTRKTSLVSRQGRGGAQNNRPLSRGRLTSSFQYVGPPAAAELAAKMLSSTRDLVGLTRQRPPGASGPGQLKRRRAAAPGAEPASPASTPTAPPARG